MVAILDVTDNEPREDLLSMITIDKKVIEIKELKKFLRAKKKSMKIIVLKDKEDVCNTYNNTVDICFGIILDYLNNYDNTNKI